MDCQIRKIGVDLLLRAEQRWPALRAAILSGTTGWPGQLAAPDMDSRQAASWPGSVKASRWSPKAAMISRRPPRAST
jgi:hypothetical protein